MPRSTSRAAALWCKSHFSFLEGASEPEALVLRAHRLGLSAIALTDRDGLYGVVRAHVKAKELGLQLIIGVQMTLSDDSQLLLLAKSAQGYSNLCRLVSIGRLRSPKGTSSVSWEEVSLCSGDLLAIWGGAGSLLARKEEPLAQIFDLLGACFQHRLYALVSDHLQPLDLQRNQRTLRRARKHKIPLLAANEVLYSAAKRRPVQDVLTCIRHGCTLHNAGRRLKPNAQHALLSPKQLSQRFACFPQALANTLRVAEQCTFSLDELNYRYPLEARPGGTTSIGWLRELTLRGAQQRYRHEPAGLHPGGIPTEVRAQLEKELGLIERLQYSGYFLTMAEIVRFCKEKQILCQGRGSAANSAVCFCLGITAIDPVRMGFLFERFISMERAEPPDIDLDIAHERREEVIAHVYQKYGRSHAAMVANFVRYRRRSALRDVGKVLGLSEEALQSEALNPGASGHPHLQRLCKAILDTPRHLSIHPGGFLLGCEPITTLVPIENATMEGRTVIQWDKEDVENMGLFKVDLLGLGALTQVDRSLKLLREHKNIDLCMASIPKEDQATYDMLSRGDTVGVFQVESRAQMAMLPRLKPRCFYDLVIEVSLVRPGPIAGGMVHPYLRRRDGKEEVRYPHPDLEPVLRKTLGVPVFQEQVMRLAMVAADYTPGEADQLRRDMAAWRKTGRIESHRERLLSRMVNKGICPQFALQIFEQIRGFGEYGFPESHAASFSVIVYATSWLKCHHPEVFTCALLNSQPMGFYSVATLIDDARRGKVSFLPVDVRSSHWNHTLQRQQDGTLAIRMGLRSISGLFAQHGSHIEAEQQKAPFAHLRDFCDRTALPRSALVLLAEAQALAAWLPARRDALWAALGRRGEQSESSQAPLLVESEPSVSFKPLDLMEQICWDYKSLHHSLQGHPLSPLRSLLTERGLPDAKAVSAFEDGHSICFVGLVICRQRPKTASGVVFMTLEDESGFVNVVLWKQIFERYEALATSSVFLGISGVLQAAHGVSHLIAKQLWRPQLDAQAPGRKSRDFH